jgi:hypothetical protein
VADSLCMLDQNFTEYVIYKIEARAEITLAYTVSQVEYNLKVVHCIAENNYYKWNQRQNAFTLVEHQL